MLGTPIPIVRIQIVFIETTAAYGFVRNYPDAIRGFGKGQRETADDAGRTTRSPGQPTQSAADTDEDIGMLKIGQQVLNRPFRHMDCLTRSHVIHVVMTLLGQEENLIATPAEVVDQILPPQGIVPVFRLSRGVNGYAGILIANGPRLRGAWYSRFNVLEWQPQNIVSRFCQRLVSEIRWMPGRVHLTRFRIEPADAVHGIQVMNGCPRFNKMDFRILILK